MEHAPHNNWLAAYRNNITSHTGEDGVLQKAFEVAGIATEDRWCVEFGAGDGVQYSNTWHLLNGKNWHGILIEADRSEFAKLTRAYRGNQQVTCLNRGVGTDGPSALDAILAETPLPRSFGFLSIDIDGNDFHVWAACVRYEPKLVLIEFNPWIPADVAFIQPREKGIRSGSSLRSIARLGKEKGYELVYAAGSNALFVRRELFGKFHIADNDPHVFLGDWGTGFRFFQLYDGSIVLYGVEWPQLLARKKKIKNEPLWLLAADGTLRPVHLRYDKKLMRAVKEAVKSTALYPYMRSAVYGGMHKVKRFKKNVKKLFRGV